MTDFEIKNLPNKCSPSVQYLSSKYGKPCGLHLIQLENLKYN